MTTTRAVSPRGAEAHAALERGRERLLAMRRPAGYWWEELESNAAITAEHVFLLNAFGIAREDHLAGLAAELLATQSADGGWRIHHGGPPDLSITVEAHHALRLCGLPAAHPALRRARELIRSQGGAGRARFFTRLWLAVLGEFPWSALPFLPPEMIFLPPRAPLSPYRFACWARGTFVALMIVLSRHPTYPQAVSARDLFLEEPGTGPATEPRTPGAWTPWLARAERVARTCDRRGLRPLRGRAERRIARWICDRQEADGSWGGIQPPWVYSLIALHALGFPLDHPVMRRGLEGFDDTFTVIDGDRRRIQACLSPVWDTALATIALLDAGHPPDDPRVQRTADWLLAREVTRFGDWWEIPRRGRPGGWSFEFENTWYPDTDDTAEVLIALRRAGIPAHHPAVRRGVAWLLAMQSRGGGWGSFDIDNDVAMMRQLPVCDFGEVIDPPTEDVTAHVVEALIHCGVDRAHPAVRAGVRFLWRSQRSDGSWWGRWGVNHVYGTGAVLPALAAAGEDMHGPGVERAVRWLERHQNGDGGWGERVESYREPEWIGRGPSTPSQTAWALLALHAVRPESPAVARGVAHLVQTQDADGSWDEPWFTGTGFPSDFMINYHGYRQYFPVTALGRLLL